MSDPIQNLKTAIQSLTTIDQIKQGYDMLKAHASGIQAMSVLSFRVGDLVAFTGKHNVRYAGRVEDVNRKTVTVKTAQGPIYRVAPSLLTIVDASKLPATRHENDILNDLAHVFNGLSPENLSCDGEASYAQIRERKSRLLADKARLFAELGREIDESEVYALTEKMQ